MADRLSRGAGGAAGAGGRAGLGGHRPPWTIQVTQNPSIRFNNLQGVSCPSATRCLAAGFDETNSVARVLPETWNGTIWQVPTLVKGDPLGGASGAFLTGDSCPVTTKCEMAGRFVDAHGNTLPLAAVWNGFLGKASVGSTWLFVLASNFNGVPVAQLNGVSCTADGACMAVGQQSNPLVPAGTLTLALKWIRGQFFLLNATNPSQTSNVLHGVSCTSASNCLAVGHFQDFRGQQDTLAEHWDGTSWSFESMPNPVGTVPDLNDVSCSSPGVCTAVGLFRSGTGQFQTLAERFVAAGSPHGFSLTSRGTVLALLHKPRTLELLVFQRGRHGHLLGAVALGSHPRGLSRIRWNLRVGGQKLRAGTYTAELVAVFARGVTSDGPSVTFDLTCGGLVRVLSATCPVAAAERGRR